MDDYYSFAAFFCQIGRKKGEDYRETIVFNRGGGEVRHPVGNRVMAPKFLGGDAPDVAGQGPPRGAGRVADLARESVLRHQRGQPRLGPLLRHRDRRAGRRHPRQQSAQQPRTVRGRWARSWSSTTTTSSNWSATSATRMPTSGSTCRNASNETDERNFAHANVRRDPGRNAAGLHQPGDRRPRTSSAACRWAPGPCRSPTARPAPTS